MKNPSLLLQVIQGRRNLTANTLSGFLKALKLPTSEGRFFRALVDFDQAPDGDAKQAAWRTVCATKRFREARQLDADAVTYLSHWYIPAARELAGRSDFRLDAGWLGKMLRPRITRPEAQRAIEVLLSLDLVRPDGRGGATQTDRSVVTPHEARRMAVAEYHRESLRLAASSIERIPNTERHLGGVTALVSKELIGELKAEVVRFQERVLELCDASSRDDAVVVQLNLQLFPLSAAPESPT